MSAWLARLVEFRRGEAPLALLAALFHFLVLAGYHFLRPVREAMGVSEGIENLRWLFAGTSVASLVLVLAFGGVVSRTDRRRFIPIAYLFVIACLVVFAGLLVVDIRSGGELIGTESQSALARSVGIVYYVWLSAINLFITSVLWAYFVDVFDVEQGKRLFPFIGAGGTLGAYGGSKMTELASQWTTSSYLPVGLLLTGAGFFAAAIVGMLALDRAAVRSSASRLGSASASHLAAAAAAPAPRIGGSFLEGISAIVRSPYLLGIGAYLLLMGIANTLLYFSQAHIVLTNSLTFRDRVRDFAQFDNLAQLATLLTQIFVTAHLIRRLGVGGTLAVLPVLILGGFAALARWPYFGVMAAFQAIYRAGRFAIARPARETLFSIVPPAEKYKAKPVLDVFFYRAGDLAGAGIEKLLDRLSLAGFAAATLPLSALWAALSIVLGRAQAKRVASAPARPDAPRAS
jgi:AAA family ATP:ADP antiporter